MVASLAVGTVVVKFAFMVVIVMLWFVMDRFHGGIVVVKRISRVFMVIKGFPTSAYGG